MRETIDVRIDAARDARTISFRNPDGVADAKWLQMGIPIHGEEVTFVVGRNEEGRYHYPDFKAGHWVSCDWVVDLTQVLAAAEESLSEFLRESDYEVRFG